MGRLVRQRQVSCVHSYLVLVLFWFWYIAILYIGYFYEAPVFSKYLSIVGLSFRRRLFHILRSDFQSFQCLLFRTRYYRFSLYTVFLIRIFFVIDLLIYSRRMVSMQCIVEFYYRLFVKHSFVPRKDSIVFYAFYGFYRFINYTSQSRRNIIDHLTNSAHFILFRRVSLLKFWQYFFISRHHVSIIIALSEDLYGSSAEDV